MISLFRPDHDEREVEAVRDVLLSGWTGLGPKVEEFEENFARSQGAKYGVATNSCTSALELCLRAIGVGGGRVAVPTITFASTAHAVKLVGGEPVFCDVDSETLMMDPGAYDEYGTRGNTGTIHAIIPVVYGGQPIQVGFKMPGDIPVIWDCAHAAGSAFDASGKTCCWSFHSVKNLATADGGMVTTDDAEFAAKLKKLRWLGIDKSTHDRSGKTYSWEYDIPEVGIKAHMNDITAAIGLVQLAKLPNMQAWRRVIAERYDDLLKDLPIERPPLQDGHGWHLYVIRTDHRDELQDYMKEAGIATGVHYKPLHLMKCYYRLGHHFPVADVEWKRILSLPMHPRLTETDLQEIAMVMQGFFDGRPLGG